MAEKGGKTQVFELKNNFKKFFKKMQKNFGKTLDLKNHK